MQPVDDPARAKFNSNPKWGVPIDLIEWQPVYHQKSATGEASPSYLHQALLLSILTVFPSTLAPSFHLSSLKHTLPIPPSHHTRFPLTL
jgi:hypothetical protein